MSLSQISKNVLGGKFQEKNKRWENVYSTPKTMSCNCYLFFKERINLVSFNPTSCFHSHWPSYLRMNKAKSLKCEAVVEKG